MGHCSVFKFKLLLLYSYKLICSAELQQWAGELEQLLPLATESCQKLLTQPSLDAMTSLNQDTAAAAGLGLRDVLKIILEQCSTFSKGDPQIHIQVHQCIIIVQYTYCRRV